MAWAPNPSRPLHKKEEELLTKRKKISKSPLQTTAFTDLCTTTLPDLWQNKQKRLHSKGRQLWERITTTQKKEKYTLHRNSIIEPSRVFFGLRGVLDLIIPRSNLNWLYSFSFNFFFVNPSFPTYHPKREREKKTPIITHFTCVLFLHKKQIITASYTLNYQKLFNIQTSQNTSYKNYRKKKK